MQIQNYQTKNQINQTVSRTEIIKILNYVDKEEVRPFSCTITSDRLFSINLCQSPTYTKVPVNYVSSSELMISIAQNAHLLIDNLVKRKNFKFKELISTERLEELRNKHEIYFIDIHLRFHGKVKIGNYNLTLDLINYNRHRNIIFAEFHFNINKEIKGNFKACLIP